MKITIGLDISTTTSGVAIFKNNEYLRSFAFTHKKSSFENYGEKMWNDAGEIVNIIDKLMMNFWTIKELNIAIEVSNASVGNKYGERIGQDTFEKLAYYRAIWITALRETWLELNPSIKLIEAQDWQYLVFGEKLDRAQGKAKSIEIARQFKQELNSDDEADAIHLANNFDILKDKWVKRGEKKKDKPLGKKLVEIEDKVAQLQMLQQAGHRLSPVEKAYLTKAPSKIRDIREKLR